MSTSKVPDDSCSFASTQHVNPFIIKILRIQFNVGWFAEAPLAGTNPDPISHYGTISVISRAKNRESRTPQICARTHGHEMHLQSRRQTHTKNAVKGIYYPLYLSVLYIVKLRNGFFHSGWMIGLLVFLTLITHDRTIN